MTDLAQLEERMREAAAGIEAARGLLAQGDMIDLAGLEGHIEALCSEIATLAGENRQRIKPRLVALIDELNTLAGTLQTQHERLTGELKDISTRQRAVSAYGAGEKPPPGGEKN